SAAYDWMCSRRPLAVSEKTGHPPGSSYWGEPIMATITSRQVEVHEEIESEIPPLENGDHLTREEFERRYDAMPGLKKAELIEGIVYMPPSVSFGGHSAPHFDLIGWLSLYRIATPGIRGGDNGSI